MTGYKSIVIILIIACGVIFSICNHSWSFTIQLKNGYYSTGEIISSDDQGIEFKSWDNNGTLKIKWHHFNDDESYRIKNILSFPSLSTNTYNIDGYKIYLRNGGIYEGIIIDKNHVSLKIKTILGIKHIAHVDILRMNPLKINPLEIYTPHELYLEKAKTFDQSKASDNFEIAEYCKNFLKIYDKANEHYYKSIRLSDSYRERASRRIAELNKDVIRGKEVEIENLLANKDVKSIGQAKDIVTRWRKENSSELTPDIEKAISAMEEKIKEAEETVVNKHQREFTKKIHQQCYNNMKSLIKKISSQEITYQDTISYINTMLYKQIIEKISKDNKIAEEEVINVLSDKSPLKYDDLPRREASYSDGTWIIYAETQYQTPSMTPEEFAKYQKRIKAITDAKDKATQKNELTTPEEWWGNAKTQKEPFLEALFSERYMYVVERKSTPCLICNGEGVINKNLCKRCWGVMADITIVYK